jgi:Predicted AAA-ATPase/PD-(D/E)XK nuclease superfamily
MPKKLPLGLQDFRGIIEDGYKYIDKTRFIHAIVTSGKYYFLSRPRRFGKSITLATLHELYNGSKTLFKGLWIEDKWDWNKKNPVLHITLTGSGFVETGLEKALHYILDRLIRDHDLPPVQGGVSSRFDQIIYFLSKKGKVVVLVDEYDAPIIHYLATDLVKAYENRDLLKEFYTVLKTNEALLELVFLTGVSKFSKIGIFSGLNNLADISMHPAYATMLGYSQEELENNFSEEIEVAKDVLKLSREDLLEKLRVWYNGYRFEEMAEKVYNPVSINNFFDRNKFENFWFATGTPTFLVNLLKKEGIFDLNLPAINPSGFESFELDRLKPEAILFQTGYLTIKQVNEDGLVQLAYPNKEVRDSMLEVLIEGFLNVDVEHSAYLVIRLRNAFRENDIDKVMHILQGVFANIPYFLKETYPEKFFHAAIHLLFSYLGVRIHSEVCTAEGRLDSMVETDAYIFILEFKIDKSPQVALEQIRQKKYYQSVWHAGKPVIGVGVQFSKETRNIEHWEVEAF